MTVWRKGMLAVVIKADVDDGALFKMKVGSVWLIEAVDFDPAAINTEGRPCEWGLKFYGDPEYYAGDCFRPAVLGDTEAARILINLLNINPDLIPADAGFDSRHSADHAASLLTLQTGSEEGVALSHGSDALDPFNTRHDGRDQCSNLLSHRS